MKSKDSIKNEKREIGAMQKQTGKKAFLINSMTGGGAEKVVSVIAEHFLRIGEDFEIICLEKNDFFIINKKINYLSHQTGKEHLWMKLAFLFILALRLKDFVKKYHFSIVQSHLYRANYVNIISNWLGSPHSVQIVNHGSLVRYNRGIISGIKMWFIKIFYAKANLIITPSRGMKNEIERLLQHRDGRQQNRSERRQIIVIPNPFDLEKIKKNAAEKSKRE